MGVPDRLRTVYGQLQPVLLQLEGAVVHSIRAYCDRQGYLFRHRLKSLESLSEKLESGRYATLSAVDDLLACTVVVPTTSHESDVLEFLRSILKEVELKARNRTEKPPDVFRFDTTRFFGRFEPVAAAGYDARVSWFLVEVQVPTAFEYAWAVVTHDLTYKSADIDWRRLRLAAHLKAAVEQMDLLIETFEDTARAVPRSSHMQTEEQEEIVARCRALIEEGCLPTSLTPTSWSRFATNTQALVTSYTPRRADRHEATSRLLGALEATVRATKYVAPTGGSLFQLVLGVVHAGVDGKGSIDEFYVIESDELQNLHGVRTVPRPLDLDWVDT